VPLTHNEILALELAGQWAKAADEWRKTLPDAASPEEALQARCALVRCHWHDCRTDDAERELAAAFAELTPATPPVVRGRLLLEQGRLQEFRGSYRFARERYVEARHLLSAEGGGSHEALLLLARMARETGDTADAAAALDSLEGLPLTDLERAELLDEQGALHIDRGHFDLAARTLNDALSYDQGVSEYRRAYTRLRLAEAYIGLGRSVDAEEELQTAQSAFLQVHDHRGLSETFELLGRLFETRQEYHRAAKAYHDGLEHDYNSEDEVGQARAYRHLARCYRNLGQQANAESALDDAERVLPHEHDVEKAALRVEQGHLACDSNDYDEAIRRFKNAIDLIEPDDDPRRLALARRGLARALREDSQLTEAATLLELTGSQWPDDGDRREFDDLLDDLAEVYLELDRVPEAKERLMESLKIGDDVGSPQSQGRTKLLLSQALFALGERAEAQTHLNDALNIFEDCQSGIGNTTLQCDALMQKGLFHVEDGQLAKSIELFTRALKLATRRSDVVRVARAQRELAGCYRRRGDLARAEDFVDDADMELRETDDRMERELLNLERARLDLARWQHGDLERRLKLARSFFASKQSVVRAALCDGLLGRLEYENHRYDAALRYLHQAREVFAANHISHELDEVYDDIAQVHLQLRQLREAETALDDSFRLDKRLNWHAGGGRTLLLKAQLALLRDDVPKARQMAADALAAFGEARDELGGAEAHLLLGDCALEDKQPLVAVVEYKRARRLDRGHSDQLGMASCYRRLGHAYLVMGEYARADEALEQADDYLAGLRVVRELAPLERDRGQLKIDWHNDYGAAVSHFERSLRHFRELGDDYGFTDICQRLIAAHQARNNHDEAFKYMQEMGLRHASMWTMLAKELDPALSEKVTQHFAHKTYSAAVSEGFKVVEAELRQAAADAGVGRVSAGETKPDTTVPIQTVLKSWLTPGQESVPRFAKDRGVAVFRDLCVASFEFIRNPTTHHTAELTPQQAFTSLCLGNLILTLLKTSA
jgi:tetratricopeptide (TPR) repeat protein